MKTVWLASLVLIFCTLAPPVNADVNMCDLLMSKISTRAQDAKAGISRFEFKKRNSRIVEVANIEKAALTEATDAEAIDSKYLRPLGVS